MFLISLLLQAHAGPLADGVRGNAWGSAFSLGAPPQDAGCRASLGASTNSWACQEHLAGASARVVYVYSQTSGLMSVGVTPSLPRDCSHLRNLAHGAYGSGEAKFPGTESLDWRWSDAGPTVAEFQWRDGSCFLFMTHVGRVLRHEDGERRRTQDALR